MSTKLLQKDSSVTYVQQQRTGVESVRLVRGDWVNSVLTLGMHGTPTVEALVLESICHSFGSELKSNCRQWIARDSCSEQNDGGACEEEKENGEVGQEKKTKYGN